MTYATEPDIEIVRYDRQILTAVFKNPELVRQVESLFRNVQQVLPGAITDAGAGVDQAISDAAAAQSTADSAGTAASAAQADIDALELLQFLVLAANPQIPNARTAAGSLSISITDGGAGNPATFALTDLIAILSSSPSDATAAFVNAGDLSGSLVANATYEVLGVITYQSAALTTGIGFTFTLPAGATMTGAFRTNNTTTTIQGSYNNASGAIGANTTDSAAATTNLPVTYHGIIKTAGTAGTAQLQFRTEVAASAVTLQQGLSYLIFRRIA